MQALTVAILAGLLAQGSAKPCKYWCKAEDQHYYCCPSGKADPWWSSPWSLLPLPLIWMNIGTHLGMSHVWSTPIPMEKPTQEKKEPKCPTLRPACPRSLDWYDPPSFCEMNSDCPAMQLCCYDVCLEHMTCKPAE